MGFVRRGNMAQYSGDAAWKPLLRKSQTIRNLNFGSSIDYFKGGTGKIETRTQGGTVGIQFQNNGSVNFTANDTFDRLVRPFAIRPAFAIPIGDYRYRRYSATVNSGNNRKVGVAASTEWGEFWNGDNTTVGGTLNVRPNYHVNVDLNYSRSQVALPNGAFTTHLLGTRLLYGFSPRVFFNAFIQYNADTKQISSNIRFDFIHHPLSDLYLVYDDRRDTAGRPVERAVIIKLTNLFNF
jgi:hypothetical protein